MHDVPVYSMQFDPSNVSNAINDFVNGNKDLKEISGYCSSGYDLNDIFSSGRYEDKNIPYFYQSDGITMLHYFAYHGLPNFLKETIRQYKNSNARSGYDIFQTDFRGRTAIHYACNAPRNKDATTDGNETEYRGNQARVMRILISEDFDITQEDFINNTPLDTLIGSFPTYDVVKVLVEGSVLITEKHQDIIAKLRRVQLTRIRTAEMQKTDKADFYKSFLSPINRRRLFGDSQLEEVRSKARDRIRDCALAYHKANDLFATQYLLDNPYVSIADEMVLDEISICNTECITNFDYAKQKFSMQRKGRFPIQDARTPKLASILEDGFVSSFERSSDSGIDFHPIIGSSSDSRVESDETEAKSKTEQPTPAIQIGRLGTPIQQRSSILNRSYMQNYQSPSIRSYKINLFIARRDAAAKKKSEKCRMM